MNWKRRIKRFISSVLLLSLISVNTVSAEETKPNDTKTEEARDTRTPEDKAMTTEAAYELPVDSNTWKGWTEGPKTYGEADIVMDADTGAILYAKNIDGKAYPASITKVLTFLIAMENGKLEDKVTFSANSVNGVPVGYAHIGMKVGEEIPLRDALYGMMLASANEVAYSIGESVGINKGKDYEWFVQQMNQRVKELGGLNSNFKNTNGLDDEDHYTTARDMALITKEVMKYPEFSEVCKTLQYSIPATNLQSEQRIFQQNHKMFYKSNQHYDERVIAGKTGYTDSAKNTLVTCTDDGNMKLVCVALKTHGTNVYGDTKNLIDYAYNNFERLDISSKEKNTDIGEFTGVSSVTVPKGTTYDKLELKVIPDKEDYKKGTAVYTLDGHTVGELPITFSKTYLEKHHADKVESTEKEEPTTERNTVYKVVLYVLYFLIGLIVVLFVALVVLIQMKRRRARERRRRRKAAMRRRQMQNQAKRRD